MRRAARTDANHTEIVAALRSMGVVVQSLAAVGDGCPDLLAGFRGRTVLLEVKDGGKSASRRVLTPDQEIWHRDWRGGPLAIVRDVESALRAITGASQ
jgi:hypothetical protein